MREYQQKHIIRTLFYSKATIVVLFLLSMLLLRSIMELHKKRQEVEALRSESYAERQEFERKVASARGETEKIATGRGLEEYIRTTYPVVKKGEGVIVIYDDEKVPVSQVRNEVTMRERFMLWWQSIFGK